MIRAEELMLGNFLQVESGNIVRVMEIKSNSTRCSYQREDTGLLHISVIDNENLYRIPLSEEWLINFGYKHVNTLHDGTKAFEGHPYLYFKDGVGRISIKTPDIQYVHQLQNIYYALNGVELKIK